MKYYYRNIYVSGNIIMMSDKSKDDYFCENAIAYSTHPKDAHTTHDLFVHGDLHTKKLTCLHKYDSNKYLRETLGKL